MSANPYKTFGLSCPNGGDFHICENTKKEFIGCCTMDPCADGSGVCDKAHLRSASFSESSYLDIPPQSCDSTGGDDHFYTCTANDPPFIGCCSINPCVNMTCPSANLRAAVLSSDHDDRASFLAPSASSSGAKSTAASNSNSSGLSSGEVAGIVVSIITLLILMAGVVLWRRYNWNPFRSTRTTNRDKSATNSANDALMESPKTSWSDHTNTSTFSTQSQLSDPRSALYQSAVASPLPSYRQYHSAGHQHSPNGQWHISQPTQPPPPNFHPQRDDSRTWPFQSPLYETYPSPSPKLAQQNIWPGRQPVHELLAEVQSPKQELAAEERIQELRSSCVVQPLRPPPILKRVVSGGVPDSPTLGPPLSADRVHPKARAAQEECLTDGSAIGPQSATGESWTKTPKSRQVRDRHSGKEEADFLFDSTNVI